jgi:hypothetical protein
MMALSSEIDAAVVKDLFKTISLYKIQFSLKNDLSNILSFSNLN